MCIRDRWYTLQVGKGWSIEYRLPSIEEIEDDPSFIDDVLEYANSPEGLLYSEVSDTVLEVLERADVDAKERQIIWEDGQRLSIASSAQRIEAEHPGYPLDLIEEHVIEWLEGEFAPPTYTREQLDELDRLTELWVEHHRRQAEAAKKRLELATLELLIASLIIFGTFDQRSEGFATDLVSVRA